MTLTLILDKLDRRECTGWTWL